jgi:hypothetical protein
MTTLYEKRGKRYYPVAESEVWDSWPKGWHMVYVEPGSQKRRFRINPDNAALYAAFMQHEDKLVDVIIKAQKLKPVSRAITPRAKKAWQALDKELGTFHTLSGPAIMDIVEAIRDAITGSVEDAKA